MASLLRRCEWLELLKCGVAPVSGPFRLRLQLDDVVECLMPELESSDDQPATPTHSSRLVLAAAEVAIRQSSTVSHTRLLRQRARSHAQTLIPLHKTTTTTTQPACKWR